MPCRIVYVFANHFLSSSFSTVRKDLILSTDLLCMCLTSLPLSLFSPLLSYRRIQILPSSQPSHSIILRTWSWGVFQMCVDSGIIVLFLFMYLCQHVSWLKQSVEIMEWYCSWDLRYSLPVFSKEEGRALTVLLYLWLTFTMWNWQKQIEERLCLLKCEKIN